jgi:DNA-binding GntR family transcriptional regulator
VVGDLEPGDKLREVALATELGVSRPTLREALNGLVLSGMLTHQPYRGFGVSSLDVDMLRHLASTRVSLDLIAVRAIRSDPTGVCLERLTESWNDVSHRMLDDDPLAQHDAHIAFHHAIWAASGNLVLMRLWPVIESLMIIALAQDHAAHEDALRTYRLHRILFDAITTADFDEIERELEAHIVGSAEDLITTIVERGSPRRRD